ncbi:MAG: hypothetical protein ASARMPREDX12_009034 [Alectoria sarmentosa]|nr:MAG: hypothetical protein ASARMPREDX12_009034 [Alectoria sarmentosa]
MAPTTLITFMLQTPTTVFSVEILGSWDNFSKPYQLKRDRRTGPGQWRGCHTFENITCDGDPLQPSTSRDGGLKMGGTYWYFYVLDGDIEYHDPAEPSTSLCPLLPGQTVNVLDVPVQGKGLFGGSRNVSSSSLDSAVFTLDPKDKYLPPGVRCATATSAIHAPKVHLPQTARLMVQVPRNGSTRAEVAPQTSKTTYAVLTLERQRSLLSVFHRIRQTRSAGSNSKSGLVWPRRILPRASQPTTQDGPDSFPEEAKLPDRAPSMPPTRIGGFELPIQLPSTAERVPTAFMVSLTGPENNARPFEQLLSSDHSQSALSKEREQGLQYGHATSRVRSSETPFLSSYYTLPEQLRDTLSYFAPTIADERSDMVLSAHFDPLNLAPDLEETLTNPTKVPLDEKPTAPKNLPSTEAPGLLELDFYSSKYSYTESLASYATSANFSPSLASNATLSGPMSPCHLSQPETPVTSECGDEFLPPLRDSESLAPMGRSTDGELDLLLASPASRAAPPYLPRPQRGDSQYSHTTSGGFQGYSLPDHDHASVLTIRKLPSITFKEIDGASPFTQQSSKQDLVHCWNDGSEHRITALEQLVDDLGYLGGVII